MDASPSSPSDPTEQRENETRDVGDFGAEERKESEITVDLPFVAEQDLVFVRSLDTTAIVEHIGGQSSSEDSSTEDEDEYGENMVFPDLTEDIRRFGRENLQPEQDFALIQSTEPVLVDGFTDAPGNEEEDSQDEEDGEFEENDDMDFSPSASDDDDSSVPIGSALLIRVDNGEDVVAELKDLKVLDRMLYLGQMVLSAVPGDKNVQTGSIVAMEKTLTVRKMHGWDPDSTESVSETVEVSAEKVTCFSDIRLDAYCVYRDWLGIIEYCKGEAVVDFSDGSAAIVPMDPDRLKHSDSRIPPNSNTEVEGFYFPGMKVKASPRFWREAYWLRGKFRRRQRTGVIRSIKHSGVGVHWIAVRQNTKTNPDSNPPAPPPEIVPCSDVRVLDAHRYLLWQAGDCGMLVTEDSNEEEQWEEHNLSTQAPTSRDERHPPRPRSSRRQHTRANGRLIAAQRRTRELASGGEDIDSASMAVNTQDPTTVVQVVETRTKISVQWQNGVVEENIPSVNLRVNEHPGSSDFWPGMVVSRSTENMDEAKQVEDPVPAPNEQAGNMFGNIALNMRHPDGLIGDSTKAIRRPPASDFGMVVRVDLDERTAVVRWLKPNSREYFEEEDEISVYDLVARTEYDMHLSDTVLLVGEESGVSSSEPEQPRWVGQIVGKDIGDLEVQWLDGTKSHITPDQVIAVGEHSDDEDSDPPSDSENMDGETGPFDAAVLRLRNGNRSDPAFRDNWGLDESSSVSLKEAVKSELDSVFEVSRFSRAVFSSPIDANSIYNRFGEVLEASSGMLRLPDGHSQLSAAQVIFFAHAVGIRIVTITVDSVKHSATSESNEAEGQWPHPSWNELKAKIFIGLVEYLESKGVRLSSSHEQRNVTVTSSTEAAAESPVDEEMQEINDNAIESITMEVEDNRSAANEVDEEEELVPSFEILDDFDVHHYKNKSATSTGQTRLPGFPTIVRKEWTRLSKNLPPGIFVHACERFQDLMRVAIVGPKDTPYQDVLFFFDIFLPTMYPAEPPKVYFHSFGRRLNPNLYENGKVCLSILGTWDGDDVEQWDPRNSNVLRVLLSLQAMVFVDEPYYNEAGYQKQRGTVEGQTNSRTYSEKALLDCQLHLIQSVRGGTPKDFKELELKHFSKNESRLVNRLQTLSADNSNGAGDSSQKCDSYTSRGFKRSLKDLIPRVTKALEGLGNV